MRLEWGKPMLCSDVGPWWDVIERSPAGFYSYGSSSQMASIYWPIHCALCEVCMQFKWSLFSASFALFLPPLPHMHIYSQLTLFMLPLFSSHSGKLCWHHITNISAGFASKPFTSGGFQSSNSSKYFWEEHSFRQLCCWCSSQSGISLWCCCFPAG